MGSTGADSSFLWKTSGFDLCFTIDGHGTPCIEEFVPRGSTSQKSVSEWFDSASLSINAVRSVGEGNTSVKTSKSLVGSRLSQRLRYQSHSEGKDGSIATLDILSRDEDTGLEITHHFITYDNLPVLRSFASVKNTSDHPVIVTQLSSLTIGGLTAGCQKWWDDYSIAIARNTWFREAMWEEKTVSQAGIDTCYLFELREGHHASMATYNLSNRGSFSTQSFLPMGALKRRDGKDTWLWQIESSGSWKWELGDYQDSVYLAAGGPNYHEHDWKLTLAAGETFTSVPVACVHVSGDIEAAFAVLTDYRRKIIRPHQDNEKLPIIFNDYMNCLMGDPDEDKIKALLGHVARSGAEFFVIDAGWYADDSNWWDDVGEWEPSKKRFPSGFKNLLDIIREKGLIPGVWVEPEVVGIRSVVGSQLPENAFFQQDGVRVIERGRWQLDYRHPAVRERLHKIIDKLVNEYGVGYFKFDYNIEVLTGSDTDGGNTGVAHLDHQRAYRAWVGELLDKYPTLVVENCSSGAQRMDYAMLATHTLQSTSDQQVPEAYSAIAAGIPTAVLPEQSATWAYPQEEWSDEINALTVVNTLLGRIHLSGRLDKLRPEQFNLIKTGMDVYKQTRHLLKDAHPFWPLGFPTWHAEWLAVGFKSANGDLLVSVWRRGGPTTQTLKIPFVDTTARTNVELLYPASPETKVILNGSSLELTVPQTICARFFHIHQ